MAIAISGVITELLPALNSAGVSELVFWTELELYEWADEALKRMARTASVFVGRSSSAVNTERVTLPATHLATIRAGWNGTALRDATVRELEALDPAWESATPATPVRWVQDIGTESIRLYPAPAGSGTLDVIAREMPDLVAEPLLSIPMPVSGYLGLSILGAARGREGEGRMPDVADHCAQRARLYEQVFIAYWGAAA